jgi:FAD/FMN-containing dehydrogenase
VSAAPVSTPTVIRAMGVGRVAIGAALVVAPRLAGEAGVGGGVAASAGGTFFARATGIRDLVLGLAALRHAEGPMATQVQLGLAACDATDLVATVAGRRQLPKRSAAMIAAMAGGAFAAELWAAQRCAG